MWFEHIGIGNNPPPVILVLFQVCYQTTSVGLALFLLQRGTGLRALCISGVSGAVWSVGPATVWGFLARWPMLYPKSTLELVNVVLMGLPAIFNLVTLLCPLCLWHRRRAARIVAAVQLPVNVFVCVACLVPVIKNPETLDAHVDAAGVYVFLFYLLSLLITPFGLFYGLFVDTHFWTGRTRSANLNSEYAPLLPGPLSLATASWLTEAQGRAKTPNIPFSSVVLGPRLGRGGTSVVYSGTWKEQPVAVKQLATITMNKATVGRFLSEADVLHGLDHPNVVALYGVSLEPPLLCLVLERCSRSLRDHLDLAAANDPSLAFAWDIWYLLHAVRDVANGLSYIHDRGLSHGDMKCSNLLVVYEPKFVVKLSDLELATLSGSKSKPLPGGNIIPDVPNWVAPELLHAPADNSLGHCESSPSASDMYSFGMTCYEMLTTKIPFGEAVCRGIDWRGKLAAAVIAGSRPELPDNCPEWLAELIHQCWNKDPRTRPAAAAIYEAACERLPRK